MTATWTEQLHEQLDWHWNGQLRPRLDGLTDEEYLWEPVPDCWTVRPDGSIDWAWPAPDPAPITTIAWRLTHITVGCFGQRAASHFGGPAVGYDDCPGTADDALARLDAAYDRWMTGVRGLDAEALARPVGEAEGPWAAVPMSGLVLHLNREVIHHGAELALLRDLYLRR
jgi:hypothetical protein